MSRRVLRVFSFPAQVLMVWITDRPYAPSQCRWQCSMPWGSRSRVISVHGQVSHIPLPCLRSCRLCWAHAKNAPVVYAEHMREMRRSWWSWGFQKPHLITWDFLYLFYMQSVPCPLTVAQQVRQYGSVVDRDLGAEPDHMDSRPSRLTAYRTVVCMICYWEWLWYGPHHHAMLERLNLANDLVWAERGIHMFPSRYFWISMKFPCWIWLSRMES